MPSPGSRKFPLPYLANNNYPNSPSSAAPLEAFLIPPVRLILRPGNTQQRGLGDHRFLLMNANGYLSGKALWIWFESNALTSVLWRRR
jgi:hypothetical protein